MLKGLVTLLMFAATALQAEERMMELQPQWEYVADTVMGGVSTGELSTGQIEGRAAIRLTGQVSLDNNGGFIQMAFDLADGEVMDACDWSGIEIEVQGRGENYELRLRTDQLSRPWQSYRAPLNVTPEWQVVRLPWTAFEAHRIDAAFDPARLRRIGVLAIGAEMEADIAVASIHFYR